MREDRKEKLGPRQFLLAMSIYIAFETIGYVPDVGDTVLIETEVRGKYEVVVDISAI